MKIWVIETERSDIYYEDLTEALREYRAMRDMDLKPKMKTLETTEEKWSEREARLLE